MSDNVIAHLGVESYFNRLDRRRAISKRAIVLEFAIVFRLRSYCARFTTGTVTRIPLGCRLRMVSLPTYIQTFVNVYSPDLLSGVIRIRICICIISSLAGIAASASRSPASYSSTVEKSVTVQVHCWISHCVCESGWKFRVFSDHYAHIKREIWPRLRLCFSLAYVYTITRTNRW